MELKRIIARDSRAANEKAIQLYGEDVLIISTQRVDNQTELIVAVDVRAPATPPASVPATAPGTVSRTPDLPATPREPSSVMAQARVPAEPPAAARVLEPGAAVPFVSFSDWFQGAMSPQDAVAAASAVSGPVLPAAPGQPSPASGAAGATPAAPPEAAGALPAALAFGAARQSAGAQPEPVLQPAPVTEAVPQAKPQQVDPAVKPKRSRRPVSTSPISTSPISTSPISTCAEIVSPESTGTVLHALHSPSAALEPAQAHAQRRSQEIVDLLRQEMAALRQEFALSRQLGSLLERRDLSPAVEPIALGLQNLGVPAALRTLLLDGVREQESTPAALALMQQILERSVARSSAVPQQALQGVCALCGPSGAGKSSMVARLASAAAQQWGAAQVAMVSLADTRPGAWAQLQVLAAQAGVDCYRAPDLATLNLLLDDLQPRRAVFIDTPGTDFLQQASVLARELPAIQRLAVLPVDATVTSVQKIFQTPGLDWSCLMLSKMDEAAHPWPLIKALCDHSLPVAAVACSERITAPVQAFEPAVLAGLAMAAVQEQTRTQAPSQTPQAAVTARRRRAQPAAARRVSKRQEPSHVQ